MEIWEMMCGNVNDFSVLGYADPADAGIWDTHKTPFVPRRLFGGAAILKSGCPILLSILLCDNFLGQKKQNDDGKTSFFKPGERLFMIKIWRFLLMGV